MCQKALWSGPLKPLRQRGIFLREDKGIPTNSARERNPWECKGRKKKAIWATYGKGSIRGSNERGSGGQKCIQGNIRKLKKQSKKVTWGKHGKMLGRDRRRILFQRGAKGSSVLVRQGFRRGLYIKREKPAERKGKGSWRGSELSQVVKGGALLGFRYDLWFGAICHYKRYNKNKKLSGQF